MENYLLNPECWFHYIRPYLQRAPRPGWNTLAEVQGTLRDFYRMCLPLAAYHWALRQAKRLDETAFMAAPIRLRQDYKNLAALKNINVFAQLSQLQTIMGLSEDFPQLYQTRLTELQSMTLDEWEQVVSGKHVLQTLQEKFPIGLKRGPRAWDDVLSAYMFHCTTQPHDLKLLLEIIWTDAHS